MTRRIVTSPTAINAVLREARRLLVDGHPASGWQRGGQPGDPTGALVDSGWFVLQQLKVALGLAVGDEVDHLVPDVIERAVAFGIAPASAVGAAASIVEGVRVDDPRALARTIVEARGAFADTELLAAVTALTAACSARIGESMALDPVLVHDELGRRAATTGAGCDASAGGIRSTRGPSPRHFCVTERRCGRDLRSPRPRALGSA